MLILVNKSMLIILNIDKPPIKILFYSHYSKMILMTWMVISYFDIW